MHLATGALNERSFVGAEESVGGGFIEGLLQQAEAKALRRLRQYHTLAGNGGQHDCAVSGAVNLLHGVDRGNAGNRGAIPLDRLAYAVDGFVVDDTAQDRKSVVEGKSGEL